MILRETPTPRLPYFRRAPVKWSRRWGTRERSHAQALRLWARSGRCRTFLEKGGGGCRAELTHGEQPAQCPARCPARVTAQSTLLIANAGPLMSAQHGAPRLLAPHSLASGTSPQGPTRAGRSPSQVQNYSASRLLQLGRSRKFASRLAKSPAS